MKTPFHKKSSAAEGSGDGSLRDDDDNDDDIVHYPEHPQPHPPSQPPPPSPLHDGSTVASGGGGGSAWSVDGSSSVTDRIMGRMKLNLSNLGNIHFKNNNPPRRSGSLGGDDISSMGSIGGGGHWRSGSGRFGRIRRKSVSKNNPFDFDRSDDDLGGGFGGGGLRRRRSSSWSKMMTQGFRSYKGATGSPSSSTSASGLTMMEGSNSNNDGLVARGRKGRRRLSSISRVGRGLNGLGRTTSADDDYSHVSKPPVEYSLAQLRSMNEDDLIHIMQHAGVASEDITNAIIHKNSSSTAVDTPMMSEEEVTRRKKNALVALFVNSGHVKLVLNDMTTIAERNTSPMTKTTTPSRRGTADNNLPIPSSGATSTASIKSSDSKKKTKLEKIAELKIENGNVRAENKSLKKLVKKLLSQLTVAIEERDYASKQQQQYQQSMSSLLERDDDVKPSMQNGDDTYALQRSSLHSIDDTSGRNASLRRDGNNDHDDNASFPPSEVVAVNQLSGDKPASVRSRKSISTTEASSPAFSSSSKTNISQLRQQLKNERGAHENTKFRMKVSCLSPFHFNHIFLDIFEHPIVSSSCFTLRSRSLCYFKTEIDILTNEVNGLQRELGHTLESLDTANEQLNEYKESMNNMKRELRRASKKVKELSSEAEARDRLIETFSSILLKKIGGINSSGEEGSGVIGLEENIEKGMVDNLVLDQGPTRIVDSAPTA